MARKIFAGILLVLTSIFLGLGLSAIIMIWEYNQELISVSTARLQSVDSELANVQSVLGNSKIELERTLRIVDDAEAAMSGLKGQLEQAKALFGLVNGTLDRQLIPGLVASRERVIQAKATLQGLRDTLAQINSMPLFGLNVPGDALLADLIASTNSLDQEIERVQGLVQKASTFTSDSAYFLGADFTETRNNLQNFLQMVNDYDARVADWRTQVKDLMLAIPGWVWNTSVILTIFLSWFVLSQVGIMIHGLALWRGRNPLEFLLPASQTEYDI